MKEIKLSELVNKTMNKANKQISFNLRARKLKKFGLTPEQLINAKIFPKELKLFTLKKDKKD